MTEEERKEQLAIMTALLDKVEADRAKAYVDGLHGVPRPDLEKPYSGTSTGRNRAFAVMLHALFTGAYRKGQAEREKLAADVISDLVAAAAAEGEELTPGV